MNRLIIVGNGYDLALGLPTLYQNFLVWYLNEKVISKLKRGTKFSDGLWEFEIPLLTSSFDDFSIKSLKEGYKKLEYQVQWELTKNRESILLNHLFNNSSPNWADVELGYFELLVQYSKSKDIAKVKRLNQELSAFEEYLMEYLASIDRRSSDGDVISYSHLTRQVKEKFIKMPSGPITDVDLNLKDALIINFNYTHAADVLKYTVENEGINCDLIHIHGRHNDYSKHRIFGYGDETDSSFQELKDLNDECYLEHFKSYKYSRNANLRKVMSFIDKDYYDVHVIGHSCGLSDRVLLSSIFDDEFCISIVPYIRKDINNYFSLQTGISRHIKNMSDYRKKIMIESECPSFSR